MSVAAGFEARMEKEVQQVQVLNKEYQSLVGTLNQLNSQVQENETVKKEFDLLESDATIYKIIGPVLVKQEKAEAMENVKRRIEFLKGNVKRSENQIKEVEQKQSKKRDEIMKLQANFQKTMQELQEKEKQTVTA